MYQCSCTKTYPDVEYLKTLYPTSILAIYEAVSDYADRLEYEGSFMFDEFPDRELFYKAIDDIMSSIPMPLSETPGGNNYLRELVTVLLVNEFLHRRIRKNEF